MTEIFSNGFNNKMTKTNSTSLRPGQKIETKNCISDETKEIDKKRCYFPEKVFKHRRSLLIELFEDNIHMRGVYVMFVSFFLFFVITALFKDIFVYGKFPAGLNLIFSAFGKLHLVFLYWTAMNIFTILMYYAFLFWANIRQKVGRQDQWDMCCLVIQFTYYILSFYSTTTFIRKYDIPFASSMILSLETVRFVMKIHAFIRSNSKKVLEIKLNDKMQKHTVPPVSKFLYFLYAPTVVYRDEYPRTESIRWNFVFYRGLEILGVIVFQAFCFQYVGGATFGETCKTQMTILEVSVKLLEFAIPSVLLLWGIFFSLLHASQNLVGELLRFGDRMFYDDWWNCTDIQQFYKKWNLVIGDWLYTYIYKDICEKLSLKATGRNLVKFSTIILSGLVHEWVCTVSSGYFLPVISTSMTVSAIMCVFIKVKNTNFFNSVVALLFMIYGSSAISSFYGLEIFGRQNLNMTNNFHSVFFTQNCVNIN